MKSLTKQFSQERFLISVVIPRILRRFARRSILHTAGGMRLAPRGKSVRFTKKFFQRRDFYRWLIDIRFKRNVMDHSKSLIDALRASKAPRSELSRSLERVWLNRATMPPAAPHE
jgi:hypothetical protein